MVQCELCEERLHMSCEGFKNDERSRSHATNTFAAWNFLMVESGKNIFSLIFWKNGAVNEFYGAIDISYQIRGAEFPVMRGMEKPKLLHSGTCTSTSRRHVTLKSPLLLQFPYCELCDNDNKQSNYRLMNVLFCTRALFADFSKSPK